MQNIVIIFHTLESLDFDLHTQETRVHFLNTNFIIRKKWIRLKQNQIKSMKMSNNLFIQISLPTQIKNIHFRTIALNTNTFFISALQPRGDCFCKDL